MVGKYCFGGLWPTAVQFALALAFFLLSPPASFAEDKAAEEENVCIACHLDSEDIYKEVAVDWQKSVHAEAGVECQDCHGGDSKDYDEAMEETSGFMGKPEKSEIPKLCSNCHADSAKMRNYNLPSEQFEKYSRSLHGKKLMNEKNENAPSCIDCHGKHAILRVADPNSTANRKNIVKTCTGCHADSTAMKGSKLPVNQLELYKKSRHGKLYSKGDDGVPTCFDCHSSHEIKNPKSLSVRLVCSNCHTEQEEMYRKSGHWDSAQAVGKPACVDCHSNHAIETPTLAKFKDKGELNCLGCHEGDAMKTDMATQIYDAILMSQINLADGERALQRMYEWSGSGFETSHLDKTIKKMKTALKEMKVASHGLDIVQIKENAKLIQKNTMDIQNEVYAMQTELNRRKVGLTVTWIVAIAFCWALISLTNRWKRDDD